MKDLIKRMKRQATNVNKIFTHHIFDKELVFGIYKELLKIQ